MLSGLILAAEQVAEKAAEESSGGLFDLDATLPVIAIQFLLLVAILNVTFFKPLTQAIDERDNYVRGSLAEAKERLRKSEELARQYGQELAAARRGAQDALLQAQAEANKLRNQQIAAAMAEGQTKVDAAKAEIEQQRQAAAEVLNTEVEVLSQQILRKLLGDLVNA
ncbi:MAG: F0F1 ATP synthase subunit B' [Oscillatoriales cyanobacterium SM2_1_8]|nr:F0F1 ATP synthase subunit B' [Oscillatoriales cyanobacterium SM2_1_8]